VKTAAVLAIGNELLSAKIRDSNTYYLASELREAGVSLSIAMIVADEVDAIVDAIHFARKRADVVLTTGGVGPTHDDITLRAVAHAFDLPLVEDPKLKSAVGQYYGARVNDDVLSMALVPEGTELLQPAPFFLPIFKVSNVYCFPGVPGALRLLFAPWKETIRRDPFHLMRCELDVDEGEVAPLLSAIQESHPDLQLGSYPRYDDGAPYRVLVTVEGKNHEHVVAATAALTERLRSDFGEGALLRPASPERPASKRIESDVH
jgi:molybdenum cofactor synthesis domain-containing protein